MLVRINDQPVSGETWHEVFLNMELPFSMTFITPTHMALAQVPGMQDTEVHFIVRRILTEVTGPGFIDIRSNSMMIFWSEITDRPVILLDGSGQGVVGIFSLGAVVWQKLRGHMSKLSIIVAYHWNTTLWVLGKLPADTLVKRWLWQSFWVQSSRGYSFKVACLQLS